MSNLYTTVVELPSKVISLQLLVYDCAIIVEQCPEFTLVVDYWLPCVCNKSLVLIGTQYSTPLLLTPVKDSEDQIILHKRLLIVFN